jgi:hypothetical protein
MEAAASRLASTHSHTPHFASSLANDYRTIAEYVARVDRELADLGPAEGRDPPAGRAAAAFRRQALQTKEAFFRRHATTIYD